LKIARHGLRWIDYQHIGIEVKREHMQQPIEIHQRVRGSKPSSWYSRRSSLNTQTLVTDLQDNIQGNDLSICKRKWHQANPKWQY
jgi:hypothetical protein